MFLTNNSDGIAASELLRCGVSHKVDDSAGSVGKRYTRSDEIAIPFAITIDFDSLKVPHTVTLRERDSMDQLRIPVRKFLSFVITLAVLIVPTVICKFFC